MSTIILAISETMWQTIIGAVVTIAVAWIGMKLKEVAKMIAQTHSLVNGAMGTQLKLNAMTTRRLAMMTQDQMDVDAAAVAEKALSEHEAKQVVADGIDK